MKQGSGQTVKLIKNSELQCTPRPCAYSSILWENVLLVGEESAAAHLC